MSRASTLSGIWMKCIWMQPAIRPSPRSSQTRSSLTAYSAKVHMLRKLVLLLLHRIAASLVLSLWPIHRGGCKSLHLAGAGQNRAALRVKSCDEEIIALETRSYDASGATSSPPYLSTGYDEQISSRRSV